MTEIERAGAALRVGRLVVLPTDTVYGIAALPRSHGGVAGIFEAKRRPEANPLPVLGATVDDLADVVAFDDRARALGRRFWPGPLTLVLPRAAGFVYDLGGDDLTTVGVRIPESPLTRSLLERTGPLAVSSANRSGEPPATSVDEARAYFGDEVAVYLDGGRCAGRVSTVVSMTGDEPVVLRSGAIAPEELQP